ncbi:MAG TPA: sialidase family protein [Pirellulales bacterium]
MIARSLLLAATLCGLLLAPAIAFAQTTSSQAASPVEVQKIWEAGNHNAFTDLLFHQNEWFCVFREGKAHVSPDGALRVLTSPDGEKWTSAALVTLPEIDLRDAKISVTPQGKLMLCGAGVTQPPVEKTHQSYVWFSDDGRTWSEPTPIGDKNFWIWRITWHQGVAYGVGYYTGADRSPSESRQVRLYKSDDGKAFETLVSNLGPTGFPNEASLLFVDDDSALCVLRFDPVQGGKDAFAALGKATAPYTDWKWESLGVQIGGPQVLKLEDGRLVVAGRSYPGGAKTKLWFLDPAQNKLTEFAALPSGGDTSYPGLVQRGDQLWVSYYSSHEGKTCVYLAQVKLPEAK